MRLQVRETPASHPAADDDCFGEIDQVRKRGAQIQPSELNRREKPGIPCGTTAQV